MTLANRSEIVNESVHEGAKLVIRTANSLTDTASLAEKNGDVNDHPVLPETFVEFGPAYHAAPPVAVESLRLSQSPQITARVELIVHAVPGVEDVIVIRFPLVPRATRFVTVCAVPAVKITDFGALIVNVVKVLEPVNVHAPVPPPVIDNAPYVLPPPANVLAVADVSVSTIVDPVVMSVVGATQGVTVPAIVTMLLEISSDPEPPVIRLRLTAKPAVTNAPFVIERNPVFMKLNALPSVYVPPGQLHVHCHPHNTLFRVIE